MYVILTDAYGARYWTGEYLSTNPEHAARLPYDAAEMVAVNLIHEAPHCDVSMQNYL